MRSMQSLVTAFAVLLAAAGSIRAEEPQLPEGSRLLWNGDTEETSQLVQLGRVVDGGVRGKCLEAYWPDPPKRTNPVIVFGKSRPDIDLADYDELWFHAKASEPGKTFNVELRQWSGRIARLNVDPYLADGKLTTEWQLVRLPLAACRFQTQRKVARPGRPHRVPGGRPNEKHPPKPRSAADEALSRRLLSGQGAVRTGWPFQSAAVSRQCWPPMF